MTLKIFKLVLAVGEVEFIAAYSNVNALKVYLKKTGEDLNSLDDDVYIDELPKEYWPQYAINNPKFDHEEPGDWEDMTFDVWMQDRKGPEFICSINYN